MPDKGVAVAYSWFSRPSPMIHWSFKLLTLSFFLGLLVVWGIDGWSLRKLQKDFVVVEVSKGNGTQEKSSSSNTASIRPSFHIREEANTNVPNLNLTHPNLTRTQEKPSQNSTVSANLTHTQQNSLDSGSKKESNNTDFSEDSSLHWISAELEPNYTSTLLTGSWVPGGEPCREARTVDISIPSLDGHGGIELSTGKIHEFVFHALDESGKAICWGGDFFETDLSGENWKSRPPIKDFGNGSYAFSLQVHPDFAGDFILTVILLFRRYEGLKFSPYKSAFDRQLRKIPIKFTKSSAQLPQLAICKKSDFTRDLWSGRWTRHAKNPSCSVDDAGRFLCLDPSLQCPKPWCDGSLAALESNGWTYSAHCSFKLFSGESAWNCLKNRWFFFWGDSNHSDTIRNILRLILGLDEIKEVPRRCDLNITNPRHPSQSFRITTIFNGHQNETGNYQGLHSLDDEGFRNLIRGYFSREAVPDTVVLNSGLHDGVYWKNVRRFAEGAERAAAFWAEVVGSVSERGLPEPRVVFRSTVATGGYARTLAFNPHKMEAFNGVLLEKLRRRGVVDWVVDHFDMTFPWHYDNRCNDGVHYGRAPAKARWRDGQVGHHYFVDLMLGHVLLNLFCSR